MTYDRETLYWELVKKLRRLEDVLLSALENQEKDEDSEKRLREQWKSLLELMASLDPEEKEPVVSHEEKAEAKPETKLETEAGVEPDPEPDPKPVVEEPVGDNPEPDIQFYALEDDDDLLGEESKEEPKETPPPFESNHIESLAKAIGRRPKLSLNDKFLFRRELFGDDTKLLQQALNGISEKSSYKEAEDYLISTFNLNPEEEPVQRFLAIVEEGFKGA